MPGSRCLGLDAGAEWASQSADYLGDLTAIAGMFFGTMVMLKSQSGFVPAEQIETEA
jgi:hypothetical protein